MLKRKSWLSFLIFFLLMVSFSFSATVINKPEDIIPTLEAIIKNHDFQKLADIISPVYGFKLFIGLKHDYPQFLERDINRSNGPPLYIGFMVFSDKEIKAIANKIDRKEPTRNFTEREDAFRRTVNYYLNRVSNPILINNPHLLGTGESLVVLKQQYYKIYARNKKPLISNPVDFYMVKFGESQIEDNAIYFYKDNTGRFWLYWL